MKQKNYEAMTQAYSTFGEKLLQHCDRLKEIQEKGKWRPINVQMSLTSNCQLDCVFCSVKNRPRGINLNFELAKKGLKDFKALGAKALELTGGGDPLLYPKINEVIIYAKNLGFEIGVITNNLRPGKFLNLEATEKIDWLRISLHWLDYGAKPQDYDFRGLAASKMGFSYIINQKTKRKTIKNIALLVQENPTIKFVRIAADCRKGNNLLTIKKRWGRFIDKMNKKFYASKFFIKEINENFLPYPHFCGVGALRPYCVENGKIYACTSYVLKKCNYDDAFQIGTLNNVRGMYRAINKRFKEEGRPYPIDLKKCWHCFYYNNNAILDSVIKNLPDKNFV